MAFVVTSRVRSLAARLALWSTVVAGVVAGGIGGPAEVRAQSVDSKIDQLVNKAANDYDNLQMNAAKKKLQRAIDVGEKQGASGAAVAEAYIMLGIVQYGLTRKDNQALDPFKKALKRNYEAEIPSVYETPDLTKLMQKARDAVPAPKGEPEKEEGLPSGPEREVDEFTHEPISSAEAGEPLTIEAFVPSDMSVEAVYFVFKRYEEPEWSEVELEATNATRFAAEVPGYRIHTTQISYYLEAVDSSGEVVARSGDENSPHQFTVLGGSGFDHEAAKKEYMAKKRGEEKADETGETDDGETDEGDEGGGARKTPVAYIDIGGGTGVGFLPGGTPTANPDRPVTPGLAPAFGHALLGGGYVFPNGAQLGLYLRWQFTPAQNFKQIQAQNPGRVYTGFRNGECLGTGIPGDCLVGLKYRWFFTSTPGIRPFASVGGGVGRIRHWLRLKERASSSFCSNRKVIDGRYCYRRDTVRPGFAHIGVGGGLGYDINETIAVVGEAYLEVLFPDTAANVDINIGPQFKF